MNKKIFIPSFIIVISLGVFYFIARTITSQVLEQENPSEIKEVQTEEPASYPIILPVEPSTQWGDTGTKEDGQGNVTVVITPKNLNSFDTTLSFDVSLDTHSVDLSMDLAVVSRIILSNGLEINASKWDAPQGGHHVAGTLSFELSEDDSTLFSEADEMTLYLVDIDAPERLFTWHK